MRCIEQWEEYPHIPVEIIWTPKKKSIAQNADEAISNKDCNSLLRQVQNNRTVLKDILLVLVKVNIPLPSNSAIALHGIWPNKISFSQKNLYVGIYCVSTHHGKAWSHCG